MAAAGTVEEATQLLCWSYLLSVGGTPTQLQLPEMEYKAHHLILLLLFLLKTTLLDHKHVRFRKPTVCQSFLGSPHHLQSNQYHTRSQQQRKTKVQCVTKSLKTLAQSVGRKRCSSIARHVLKNVKTRKKVLDILQKEMREMCRKKICPLRAMSSSKSTLPRPPSSIESSESSKTSDSSSLSGLNLDNILGPLSCTALLSLPVTALLHKGDQGTNHHDTRLRSGWTPHGTENLWQYARTRQLPTASWKTHEHIPSAEEVFTASSCFGRNLGYPSCFVAAAITLNKSLSL